MIIVYYAYSSDYVEHTNLDVLLSKLPTVFHERARRYQKLEDAYNFVLGRLLLQQAIEASELDIAIADLYYGKDGKPLLKGCSFSISHSQDLVACAFSLSGAIGLDVEYPREVKKDYFKHYFSNEEWQDIIVDKSSHTFYQYWTKKEAILKAAGIGLPHLLDIVIHNKKEASIMLKNQKLDYYTKHMNIANCTAYICLCSNQKLGDIEIKKSRYL